MFSPLKYEQNELSYMKFHQQIRKLVCSPPRPGAPFCEGVEKGVFGEAENGAAIFRTSK